VATNKGGLDDAVSLVFGRCQTFTIVDVDGKEIKNATILPNQYASGVSGVGIQAGQFVVQQGAKVAIAGNFGPNVSAVLSQAGVEIIIAQGNVEDVIKKYLNKELKPMQAPQMPFGMGIGRRGTGKWMYAPQPLQPTQRISKQQEIQMLEQQIKGLEQQLEQIKKRIEELRE